MADNSTVFDVLIIGGGPAGLSAALWCAELGLKAVIFEKESEFGGQLLWTFNGITNYLGIDAINGRELRDHFLQSIDNRDFLRFCNATAINVDLSQKTLVLADGTTYKGKAVIIATGVRRRELGVTGEKEFAGRGILVSGVKTKDEMSGKLVIIVGGGDAALENALILSETAEKIYLVHRRALFSARREFIESSRKHDNIEFLLEHQVTAIVGDTVVRTVELEHSKTKRPTVIKATAVLIRIGFMPNTELFTGQIEMNDTGHLIVDNECAASLKGIFGVGDAANPTAPTISAGVGDGSRAARAIYRLLEREQL